MPSFTPTFSCAYHRASALAADIAADYFLAAFAMPSPTPNIHALIVQHVFAALMLRCHYAPEEAARRRVDKVDDASR